MYDISAVEALAVGYENLGHDEFFGAKHAAGKTEDDLRNRALYPGVIHAQAGIADAGDQVYKVVAPAGLCQPDRILDVGDESLRLEAVEGFGQVACSHQQVEILGRPPDTRVCVHGK